MPTAIYIAGLGQSTNKESVEISRLHVFAIRDYYDIAKYKFIK